MAKTWITTRNGETLVRRSHISDVYVAAGKTEENRYELQFQYFVKATVRNETYTLAGPFDTKPEALDWMKKNFK